MKKYTVIYGDFFKIGSNVSSVTKHEHIECEESELQKYIEDKFGWGNVWFLFEGHCKSV